MNFAELALQPDTASALSRPPSPLNLTILLVEDQDDVRTSTAWLLEIWGCCVKCARNGAEALRELELGARPGLVLLDLQMPVMDGHEFLVRLRAGETAPARLPVLILSGSGETPLLEAARSLADGYLRKPADPDELRRLIEGWASVP